jgi:hypothetical protein
VYTCTSNVNLIHLMIDGLIASCAYTQTRSMAVEDDFRVAMTVEGPHNANCGMPETCG